MIKTYKVKLYHSKKNKHLSHIIWLCSRGYNHLIALHKRYYKLTGKFLSAYDLQKHFTKLKKRPHYAWLKEIPSQSLQDVAERIDKGYKLFFKNLKRKVRTAPPSFRKAKKYKSFTLKQAGWKLEDKVLTVGKRTYKLVDNQLPKGKIKTVTIKRDALGAYWACFSCEVEDIDQTRPMTGKIAGFDFGLKDFLTVHDGQETYRIESPLFFKQSMNRLAKVQRDKDRKVKGSSNRKKAQYLVARQHKRIADKRRDWFFKLAHELTDKYDVLCFEDLNLKAMQKLWGRKVTDLAFGTFMLILEFVAKQKGCLVLKIDRFYPSSKTCHCCKHKVDKLELNVRRWRCPECQSVNDRDGNASMNIRSEGIQTFGLGDVRRTIESAIAV